MFVDVFDDLVEFGDAVGFFVYAVEDFLGDGFESDGPFDTAGFVGKMEEFFVFGEYIGVAFADEFFVEWFHGGKKLFGEGWIDREGDITEENHFLGK